MRNILIVALVIALALVIIGAADHETYVNVGLLFGTWHGASLLSLFAIAAGLVLTVGVVSAVLAPLYAARSRRTLEAELESIYLRLRAAEAASPALPAVAGGAPAPAAIAPASQPVTPQAAVPDVEASAHAPAEPESPDETAPAVDTPATDLTAPADVAPGESPAAAGDEPGAGPA